MPKETKVSTTIERVSNLITLLSTSPGNIQLYMSQISSCLGELAALGIDDETLRRLAINAVSAFQAIAPSSITSSQELLFSECLEFSKKHKENIDIIQQHTENANPLNLEDAAKLVEFIGNQVEMAIAHSLFDQLNGQKQFVSTSADTAENRTAKHQIDTQLAKIAPVVRLHKNYTHQLNIERTINAVANPLAPLSRMTEEQSMQHACLFSMIESMIEMVPEKKLKVPHLADQHIQNIHHFKARVAHQISVLEEMNMHNQDRPLQEVEPHTLESAELDLHEMLHKTNYFIEAYGLGIWQDRSLKDFPASPFVPSASPIQASLVGKKELDL